MRVPPCPASPVHPHPRSTQAISVRSRTPRAPPHSSVPPRREGEGTAKGPQAEHLFRPLPAYSPGAAFALRIKFCLPTPCSKTWSLCQQPWLLPSAPPDSCLSGSKAKASLTPRPWVASPYPQSHLHLHQVFPQHSRLPHTYSSVTAYYLPQLSHPPSFCPTRGHHCVPASSTAGRQKELSKCKLCL